jgi:hypothetical protein
MSKAKEFLSKMLDATIAGDDAAAQSAFHDYVVTKSRPVVEGDDPKSNPGEKSVKATMKAAADAEIAKVGEEAADPKKAPGSKDVKATLNAAGKREIKKVGEEAADPKKAPGEKAVKATMKAAGDKEIK